MNFKKKVFGVCIVLAIGLGVQAQTATTASGGEASGSGGTVSYSLGQVAYRTGTGTNGSLTEGVQQPFEIWVMTGIKRPGISLKLSVYPNPTTDFLTLCVTSSLAKENYAFSLYTLEGKTLITGRLTGTETLIDMSRYTSGPYFVKVTDQTQIIKVFKIVKR